MVDPTSWPISSITIKGNRIFSTAQILAVAELSVGKTVDKQQLDAAHERLLGCGAFDSVAYSYAPAADYKGIVLTYEVVEVPTLYPMMFEDLPGTGAPIQAWLKQKDPLFGPKISATKEALEHYKKLVSEYLATTQDYHEPIIANLSSESPPQLVILFRPATPRPTVAQVTAKNTGEIPASVIQSTAYGVAVGTIYSEPRFRQLLDGSIRPLYEAAGHLRVSFPTVEGEPAKDVKGVAVTVTIEQGPVYKFGKIQVGGADTSRLELPKVVKIKSGELANFDEVKAAQYRIEKEFKHQGYMQVRTEALRTLHDEQKTVDVNIRITTGPLFIFRKLIIVGLDIESEPVIRKLWGLEPGKPFIPEYPDHFLASVNDMGLFDNLKSTEAERNINRTNHTVDVTLTFKGGQAAPKKKEGRPGIGIQRFDSGDAVHFL